MVVETRESSKVKRRKKEKKMDLQQGTMEMDEEKRQKGNGGQGGGSEPEDILRSAEEQVQKSPGSCTHGLQRA